MRYSVFLPLLLAACGTLGIGETKVVQDDRSYCNIPMRLMVLRTTPEICQTLGGERVDASKVDELQATYQALNGP